MKLETRNLKKYPQTLLVATCLALFNFEVLAGPSAATDQRFVVKDDVVENSYANEALKQAVVEEAQEMKRLEEERQQALVQKDDYDAKKSQAELEIQIKNKSIEDAKIERERIQAELDFIQSEFLKVEADKAKVHEALGRSSDDLKQVTKIHDETLQSLKQKSSDLAHFIEDAKLFKKESEKKANQLLTDSEKLKQNIIGIENSISKIRNQRAHSEALLVQSRNEYAQTLGLANLAKKQKDLALADKNKSEKELKAMRMQTAENVKALLTLTSEKDRLLRAGEKNTLLMQEENKRLEKQLLALSSEEVSLKAEKAKQLVESTRLAEILSATRSKKEMMDIKSSDERGLVLENRIKIEKTKTEIVSLNAGMQNQLIDNDTLKTKVRNLASMVSQSDLEEGSIEIWIMVKSCYMRIQPDEVSKKMGLAKKGATIAGQDATSAVKVLNSSGQPLFIPKSCLKPKEEL